jgi:diguanylate cyclase (GGDEF)-like protein
MFPLAISRAGITAVAAVIVALLVIGLGRAEGLSWERLHGPSTALVGLAIVLYSARYGSDRERLVRTWISLGFAAWSASQLITAFELGTPAFPAAELSLVLLAGVMAASLGTYWAVVHGRVARREELAIYLDAAIVAAAVAALALTLFQNSSSATSAVAIHAMFFLAIVAATLVFDLAVLAEWRLRGAYASVLGLACAGLGFVGRSAGVAANHPWALPLVVSLGTLVVAFGSATWSERVEDSPAYVRVATRLRGWLPLIAAGITLMLLFGRGERIGDPSALARDLAVAFVLAGTVARQSLLLTERGDLLSDTRERTDQLERRLASQRQLLAITERLLVHRERTAVFEAVADTLADVVPYDTLTIYVVDIAEGCLVPILARDEYAEQILASRPKLGAGITGDVINKGEAEIINQANLDPRVVHVPGTPEDEDEAMIVAPIRSPGGAIGALNIYRRGQWFDAGDLELVRLFTNLVAIALENATIHDQLLDAADKDPLTGLPNRRFFTERVEHALENGLVTRDRLAVLFLDVDAFKLVNDSLGHTAGDEALRAVAARLQECTRDTDTVARLGGDEFAVLCEHIQAEENAIATAQRIVAALAKPLSLDGRGVSVRASIGIAIHSGDERTTAVELLRDADTAMYRAKATRRGGFQVFEESMHAHQLARLQLEADMEQAVEDGQFRLVYQPILDVATEQLVGVEALLRWDHPTRDIPPGEFIKLAEESGHIIGLGKWVRREACHQAAAWLHNHPGAENMHFAVNVSASELVEPGFVESVEFAVTASGLTTDQLILEITESVMLSEETIAIANLRRLRSRGVHVAVDDFGTGYSSLSYLKQLPVDGLKIDRSFIEGLGLERERSAIVRATIAFARALGLVVTAEGVETQEQLELLRTMGCDRAQGFYFSRPLEASAMAELLRSSDTDLQAFRQRQSA